MSLAAKSGWNDLFDNRSDAIRKHPHSYLSLWDFANDIGIKLSEFERNLLSDFHAKRCILCSESLLNWLEYSSIDTFRQDLINSDISFVKLDDSIGLDSKSFRLVIQKSEKGRLFLQVYKDVLLQYLIYEKECVFETLEHTMEKFLGMTNHLKGLKYCYDDAVSNRNTRKDHRYVFAIFYSETLGCWYMMRHSHSFYHEEVTKLEKRYPDLRLEHKWEDVSNMCIVGEVKKQLIKWNYRVNDNKIYNEPHSLDKSFQGYLTTQELIASVNYVLRASKKKTASLQYYEHE